LTKACSVCNLGKGIDSPLRVRTNPTMARAPEHLDTESDSAGELQPLLSPSQIEEAAGEATFQSETATEEEEEDEVKDGLTWRWYGFYCLLLVLSVLAVTLLIKGFIDAGDKDVHPRWSSCLLCELNCCIV
jgi:hypothetical protein